MGARRLARAQFSNRGGATVRGLEMDTLLRHERGISALPSHWFLGADFRAVARSDAVEGEGMG